MCQTFGRSRDGHAISGRPQRFSILPLTPPGSRALGRRPWVDGCGCGVVMRLLAEGTGDGELYSAPTASRRPGLRFPQSCGALYVGNEHLHIREIALLKIARMGHPVLRV